MGIHCTIYYSFCFLVLLYGYVYRVPLFLCSSCKGYMIHGYLIRVAVKRSGKATSPLPLEQENATS